jgi:3-oxoacyl-[acyl-carrier protein] reductase
MDLGLDGKIALVTGAGQGIGYAVALGLAEEGCDVAIADLNEVDDAAKEIAKRGVRAHGVIADMMVPEDVRRFVEESAEALGGVDLLMTNVGGAFGGGLEDSTHQDWLDTLNLNLFHAVNAIRAATPYMKSRGGGSILITASISGWKPAPRAQYGAAKAAEIYLARALAQELAPHRIRINAISPGSTEFEEGGWGKFHREQPDRYETFVKNEFPWGRLAAPQEIADVAVFLLSERARWINGANICVDGGQNRPSVEK